MFALLRKGDHNESAYFQETQLENIVCERQYWKLWNIGLFQKPEVLFWS